MKIFGRDFGITKATYTNTDGQTQRYFIPRWKTPVREDKAPVDGATRGFDAAKSNNTNADWFAPSTHINSQLASQLNVVRSRCRERAINDDYAKGYVKMCVSNIVGQQGIRLQSMATDLTGKRDDVAVAAIENAWGKWGKYPENVDMAGRNNWRSALEVIIRNLAIDGEVFIRHVVNDSKFGYSINIIDPSLCDTTLNTTLPNGNAVIMGVELDNWYKPVAYYFLSKQQNILPSTNGKRHIRIDASEITHAFQQEFADQVRGIPPMAVTIQRLKMLSGFEEAALTNARAGAAKMGFFTRPDNSVGPANAADSDGTLIEEMTPATMTLLPEGYNFTAFDARYPDGEIEPFKKAILRATSTGLGVAYFDFAQDLESVNLSTARVAINETRENWKQVQQFVIDSIITPIFEKWLEQALIRKQVLLSGKNTPLTIVNIEKYKEVTWLPRRWQMADPTKDTQSNISMINNRIKSISSVASEIGIDFETEVELIARDEKLLEQYGLVRLDKQSSPNEPMSQDDVEDIANK